MSYFGNRFVGEKAFDPADIVQINSGTTFTSASLNRLYILNSPANYNLYLPALTSTPVGSTISLLHNFTSGSVSVQPYAGDFIQQFGTNTSLLNVNPGDSVTLEFTGVVWHAVNNNKVWTAPQGTNNTTPASTEFVLKEVNKHKNFIHNGNFDVLQRGSSGTLNNQQAYTADRWIMHSGLNGVTQWNVNTHVSGYGYPRHYLNVNQSTAGQTPPLLSQRLENVRMTAGKTFTLSFMASVTTALSVTINFIQSFGSGGSGSTVTNVGSINVTAGGAPGQPQRYTITGTFPSIVGKTVGAGFNDYSAVEFQFPTGTIYQFNVWNVQLEQGVAASDYEYDDFANMVANCSRYYQVLRVDLDVYAAAGSQFGYGISLPHIMRTTPTYVLSSGMYLNASGLTLANLNHYGCRAYATATSTGRASFYDWYIYLSADL